MLPAQKKIKKTDNIPTDWLKLLEKYYALQPIHNEKDYKRALKSVDLLIGRKGLSSNQKKYLEALLNLIEKYEEQKIEMPEAKPVEILKFLAEENDLTKADIGRIATNGKDPTIGDKLLEGRRSFSKNHIRNLSDYFSVDPSLFL